KIEQAAFDQLTEMAYRKRLACRGSRNSKSAVQKVSNQVALAFLKRTLGRCRRYEEAGVSCFSESTLQNIMFAPHSRENGGQPADCIVSGTASAVSSASEKYDGQRDYADRGLVDSFQGSI
ncbi:serine-rich adhesin for platelets-like, partial [Trifolium medium]|nr:serine-rich adhesin for platelets-like [Trifolium medium]